MTNNNSDIFESAQNASNKNIRRFFNNEEENPFSNHSMYSEGTRRLNDYDFNILKDGAYKDINDDVFKLEYKISKTEENINILESQISTAKEINDFNKVEELKNRLAYLKDEYNTLLALYNEKSLSAKITDFSANIANKILGKTDKHSINWFDIIISKLPQKFSSIIKIRKSLNMLENINKSVDDLVTMTIPYGENIDKYKQLSKYIIKANSIHSEISNYLKKN